MSEQEQKRRGRRRSSYENRDLREHLRAIQDLKPELKATRDLDNLRNAMKPYWRGTEPNKTMLSATLSGCRRASPAFLNALHSALLLDGESLEPEDWMRLSAVQFRQRLILARTGDLGKLLRGLAAVDEPGLIDEILSATRASDHPSALGPGSTDVLGMGSRRVATSPVFSVGDRVQLRLQLPFAGYLTVLSADPGNPHPDFYSLAPWLKCADRRFDPGPIILPRTEPLIPVAPPANVTSTLIAVLTREQLALPWANQPDELPLVSDHVRSFALDILRRSSTDNRVHVVDYHVSPEQD